MRFVIVICCLSVGMLTACHNSSTENKEQPQETAAPKAAPTSVLTKEGTNELIVLLGNYYALKDAFVASDAHKTITTATALNASVDSLMKMVKDTSYNVDAYMKDIKSASQEIMTTDQDIEKQRVPFEKISDAVYALLKNAQLKNAGVYRQYCPMAFDDKGAYWLSNEEKIRNPYFGDKMLTCGEVTENF